jgi:hypothetical protein
VQASTQTRTHGLWGRLELVDQFDVERTQLGWSHRSRGVIHQVLTPLGLGEGNDITDLRAAREEADQPVKAKGDAAVRGSPVGEGFQHIPKSFLNNIFRDFKEIFEDLFLQFRLVDTNRSASQFHTVEDTIVMLTTNGFGITIE